MGIKMAEPIFHYKNRPNIIRLSSNFELYSDMSQRVMQTLFSCSSEVEPYSIDEAFFSIENSPKVKRKAFSIRNKVQKWTGIPISIGIGPTKTLAKLASELAKKQGGVYLLKENHPILSKLPIEEVWGVGKALTSRLKKEGIYSVKDFINVEDGWIRSILGVTGYRTVLELRGIPCFKINESPEKKKSIVCSRSFGEKVTSLDELYEAVSTFAAQAAKKLRSQKCMTNFLSVFLTSSKITRSCHMTLPNATSFTPELIRIAKQGAKRLFSESQIYSKAGILLQDFTEEVQTDLFSLNKNDRSSAMQILDEINARFEKPKVHFAAEGMKHNWKSKRQLTSPKYTTRWTDLLQV